VTGSLTEAVVTAVVEGWMAVGLFVVGSVALVRGAALFTDTRVLQRFTDARHGGPVVGTLLGLVPGCGGAVVAVTLYGRDRIGFGGVVAALTATAGDAAFLLLSVSFHTAVITYAVAGVVGVLLGVVIEQFGATRAARVESSPGGRSACADGGCVGRESTTVDAGRESTAVDAGRESTAVDVGRSSGTLLWTVATAAWWLAVAGGLAVSVGWPTGADAGGGRLVAGVGVVASLAVVATPDRWRVSRDGVAGLPGATAVTVSPIVLWVVAALAVTELSVSGVSVGEVAATVGSGTVAPVFGGLLGAIPGCGVHVGFVGLYADGGVSWPALVANTISQDGDALFPLLAIDRRRALTATGYTALAGVAVGLLVAVVAPGGPTA
jgi:hypothetical protein